MTARKAKPGSRWRMLAHGPKHERIEVTSSQHPRSIMDEVVIDDWFHIEQMDTDVWWFRIGDRDGTINTTTREVRMYDEVLPADAFATELRKWWRFDERQMHTHSWHDREDFIEKMLPKLLGPGGAG